MSKYDPDAPEGAKPPSQYMSYKDIRVIAVILVLLGIICYPLYKKMEMDGKVKICKGNLEHVSKAVLLYADANDSRFPPAFIEEVANSGVPKVEGQIYPVTWVSLTKQYITSHADFGCPPAASEEVCFSAPATGDAPIGSAFGFSAGMSTRPKDLLVAPTATVMLAESSSNGVKGTYDPLPFVTPQGKFIENDGFLIGYDNDGGNQRPDSTTQYMTRLAFYNAGPTGDFGSEYVRPRHDGGLFIIFADGHLGRLDQTEVPVQLLHDEPQGLWRSK